ncbi:MAG: TetR family transcriptional regulator [Acidimicrobiia bacterium]|nr:TetR family transcriptional regulator [Acidimicrobiia bacterium]MDH4306376.1 TetR family transcriptional regulator [Acidimicrobiia bacterium]MDH5294331.1 TetR family transcriptional regulator [Acidimicrobiia bacterium]
MTVEAPNPKAELLGKVIAHISHHGLSDVSLRELAAAVGTSHRMLIYHFGSREGLVAAIVTAIEQSQREAMASLVAGAQEPAEVIRGLWYQVSAAELRPFVRLFFEMLPHALYGRPGTASFLDTLIDPWVEAAMTAAEVNDWPTDPVELRLGIAVSRGLLVDLLATDDLDTTTAAIERFIAMWEQTRSA